jgi:tetratricopeptide (TPR) repeat protein
MKPDTTSHVSLEAQYLYRRGREMMDQRKDEAALAYLRQAVFIAPEFPKAYRELGNCLARLGRPDEASAYYSKASRIDPIPGEPAAGEPSAGGLRLPERGGDQPIPGASLAFLVW